MAMGVHHKSRRKATELTVEKIERALNEYETIERACMIGLGRSKNTLYRWLDEHGLTIVNEYRLAPAPDAPASK